MHIPTYKEFISPKNSLKSVWLLQKDFFPVHLSMCIKFDAFRFSLRGFWRKKKKIADFTNAKKKKKNDEIQTLLFCGIHMLCVLAWKSTSPIQPDTPSALIATSLY